MPHPSTHITHRHPLTCITHQRTSVTTTVDRLVLSISYPFAFVTVDFAITHCCPSTHITITAPQSPPLSIDWSCPSRSLSLLHYSTSQSMQDLLQDCCISIMLEGIKFDTMQMLSTFHNIVTHIWVMSTIDHWDGRRQQSFLSSCAHILRCNQGGHRRHYQQAWF